MAEKVPLDAEGYGSNLKMQLVVARASGTMRMDQVCYRSPWPEGLEVDACDIVL